MLNRNGRTLRKPLKAFSRLTLRALLLVIATTATSGSARASETDTVNQPLKIAELASLEWLPYIGSGLEQSGYVYQLAKRAFAASGYELRVTYYPWARALHLARKGQVNGLFPEYYSESRENEFVFSSPFPSGPVSLFKRSGSQPEFKTDPRQNQEQALRELSQYRFGVVRGYVNTKALDNADFLRREEARSDELNLRKLQFGRVDLVAIDPYVAQYLLSTTLSKSTVKLERMQPALERKTLHIAFSRRAENHQELLTAFNAGLKSLRDSGELEALLREYAFDELANELLADQAAENSSGSSD